MPNKAPESNPYFLNSRKVRAVLTVISVLAVLFFLVLLFFPWDALRGPINRYVSSQLERQFEITRHLDVSLGRTTTVRLEGLELANPKWAKEPYLIKATAAEFDVALWPLLFGKVVLPRLSLTEPQIGLQVESDGRRTWALSQNTSDAGAVPQIGSLMVDKGALKYLAVNQGADLLVQFAISADTSTPLATSVSAAVMPLAYKASGTWKNEAFSANGRTGSVLQLGEDMKASFPIEINAAAGRTTLKAQGSVENLLQFNGLDATFDLQGRNLEELFKLAGVVLPSTPAYKLRGKLSKHGPLWSASQIQGVLGSSDLNGELRFDTSQAVAKLTGTVQSKLLDFEDLRPVIGLPAKSSVTVALPATQSGAVAAIQKKKSGVNSSGKVLPTATLDLVRLKAMNADVIYSAADIRHVEQLPLDKGSVHVKLASGILQLEPIMLGVAGGSLAGQIRIDSNVLPAALDTRLDVRAVQLNKLFPTIENTKNSLGKISGQINLKGRGNSAAQMLGSASGDVALLMGKGEISNILLEFIGLDGGEVIKFFLRGDRNVQLLCSAAAFEVKQGLMTSKVIVLDTTDTVINGRGLISLTNETLDLTLDPLPKDHSILSFRSPLKITGTFASPAAGPDKAALGTRAGVTLALGLLNPLLALAATFETGPGVDADCRSALALAADPKAIARAQPASAASSSSNPSVAAPAAPAAALTSKPLPSGAPGVR